MSTEGNEYPNRERSNSVIAPLRGTRTSPAASPVGRRGRPHDASRAGSMLLDMDPPPLPTTSTSPSPTTTFFFLALQQQQQQSEHPKYVLRQTRNMSRTPIQSSRNNTWKSSNYQVGFKTRLPGIPDSTKEQEPGQKLKWWIPQLTPAKNPYC